MGLWVKTTVDISDELLSAAKRLAANEGSTLRALIEDGLREVLARRERSAGFRLRDASFAGKGLQQGLAEDDWQRIREISYEGRGG